MSDFFELPDEPQRSQLDAVKEPSAVPSAPINGDNGQPNQPKTNGKATVWSARDFLLQVVPWPTNGDGGFITICWQIPGEKGFLSRSYRTIDEAIEQIDRLQAEPVNVYFCLSRQRRRGRGSRADATFIGSGWFDLDFKLNNPNNYASLTEAIAAVFRFCDELGIPRPSLIVFSGGGLHVYWLSTVMLTVEDWQPYADALKNAARAYGLKADLGCTGDAARVLRVPGTRNHKYDPPPTVRVLDKYSTGERHDFAKVFAPLLKIAPVGKGSHKTPKPIGTLADAFKHLPLRSLGAGIEGPPPLDLKAVEKGCGWLRHAHATGGADQSEPLWRDALRCLVFFENGETLIHEFSEKHADYDYNATEVKYDRARQDKEDQDLGYPLCQTICDHELTHCKACPHLKLGKSPLHLALQGREAPAKSIFDIGTDEPTSNQKSSCSRPAPSSSPALRAAGLPDRRVDAAALRLLVHRQDRRRQDHDRAAARRLRGKGHNAGRTRGREGPGAVLRRREPGRCEDALDQAVRGVE